MPSMITFSEAVTGFDNTDITIENGTVIAMSRLPTVAVTWTGEAFSSTTNGDTANDSTDIISVGTASTDLAVLDAPLAGASSANDIVDTVEPTLVRIVMDHTDADIVGADGNKVASYLQLSADTDFGNSRYHRRKRHF